MMLGITGASAQTIQVADTAGHTLLTPGGTPNTDPATQLPDSTVTYPQDDPGSSRPIYLLGGGGPYIQTVRGTGSGTYEDTLFDAGFVVHVQNVTAIPGVDDVLTLDPRAGSFQFQTNAASKTLSVELIAQVLDQSERTAPSSIPRVSRAAATVSPSTRPVRL